MARAFLGVGSNIRPEQNVVAALELLSNASGVSLTGISTFYRTHALPNPLASPFESDFQNPDFLNGVLEIATGLPPRELECVLAEVEETLGRERSHDKYAPRVMDLDVLVYLPEEAAGGALGGPAPSANTSSAKASTAEGSAAPVPERRSAPPHPDVLSRGFVAFPLFELAPALLLPPLGRPLADVVAEMKVPGGEPETQFTAQLRARFLKETL
jgi:2-amino-4-hydroxy-6-hydroxymethyldihydropteridine diphosphokinase